MPPSPKLIRARRATALHVAAAALAAGLQYIA